MAPSRGVRRPPTYPKRATVVRYRKGLHTMADTTGAAAITAPQRWCRRHGW